MLNHFTFNGHSTGELGLLVSGINIYGSPSRIVEKVTIPYRSGDLIIDTGAYTNYMLTYTVDIMDNTKATAEAISKWLLGSKGYCELTDTYNPEIYRVASYYNQLDYTLSALYRYGKATITFDCKPQKYLTANQPVSLSSTLSEETSYSLSTPAMPLPLTLEGNTTQKTLSGKNLLEPTGTTETISGVTFTVNADGTITANGTATEDITYVCSDVYFDPALTGSFKLNGNPSGASGTTYRMRVRQYANGAWGSWIYCVTTDPKAVELTSATRVRANIMVASGTTLSNAVFKPMLYPSTADDTYEQYCGGIPSPNPDYPQEIHSVKGDNEVRVVGKNLWDNEKAVADSNNSQTYIDGEWLRFQTGNNRLIYNVECEGTLTLQGIFKSGTTASTTIALDAFYTDGTSSTLIAINTADTDEHFVSGTTTSGKNVSYIRSQWINTREAFAKNIQLELGSTATTYEPYKAQVYPINLPVENQISTDYSALTVGSNYAQYLTIGDTVTLSLTDKDTSVDISGIYVGMLKSLADSTAGYYWVVLNGNVQAKKYTTSQYKYFTIYPKDENTWARILARFDVQVEVGSVANHYTPYGVAPIELNALGNYKDYFYKNDGKWYLHKEINKVTLDGSENWSLGSEFYCLTAITSTQYSIIPTNGNIKSNYYVYSGGATNDPSIDIVNGYIVRIKDTTKADVNALKTWLASNNTEVIYPLATPTNTEITNSTLISQLNAISKAKTYDGSTTIVQDGTDAQFKLSMPVPAEVTSEYKGEPIITVSEVGTIVWNDSLIKVNSAPVTINSQTLQCYYYSENKNNDVEINEFPKYEQGENYIGSTMDMSVVPNYWKL